MPDLPRSAPGLRLVLASQSPRRRQLLTEAGYAFEVDPSRYSEPDPEPGQPVAGYVAQLAWQKAREVGQRRSGPTLILAADTSCSAGGLILNKPTDRADAERMLRWQEGTDTEVVTGVCLLRPDRDLWVGFTASSVCRCRPLTDTERSAYLDSSLWEGKAGAYGVQDDDPFVAVVAGEWSNVVGLPLGRLAQVLAEFPGLTAGLDSGSMTAAARA